MVNLRIGTKYNSINLCSIFFYLSIFFSPFRVYGFLIGGFSFSFFRIFGIAFIISFIVQFFNRPIRFVSEFFIISFLFLITFGQIIYSPAISGGASSYFSMVFGYFWIIFAFLYSSLSNRIFISIIITIFKSSVFILALGMYQTVSIYIANKIPSLPFQSLQLMSRGPIQYNIFFRVTASFDDPTYYSTFLTFVIIFSLYLILNKDLIKLPFSVFLGISLIFLLSVFQQLMSFSISGSIGILFGISMIFLFGIKRTKMPKLILLLFFLLMFTGILLQNINNVSIFDGFVLKVSALKGGGADLFGRKVFIDSAIRKIMAHPFFGNGFGGLSIMNSGFSTAHSSLLTVWGQQGLFVLLINIVILFLYPITLIKHNRYHFSVDQILEKAISFSLLSVLVLTFGYDTLYSMDFNYVIILLVLLAHRRCIDRIQ